LGGNDEARWQKFYEATTLKDDAGQVVMSGIHTYGEVVHLLSSATITAVFSCPDSRNGNRITARLRLAWNMSIIAWATLVGTG